MIIKHKKALLTFTPCIMNQIISLSIPQGSETFFAISFLRLTLVIHAIGFSSAKIPQSTSGYSAPPAHSDGTISVSPTSMVELGV